MKNKSVVPNVISALFLAAWSFVIFWFSAQPEAQSKTASGTVVRAALSVLRFFGLTPQAALTMEKPLGIAVRKCAHFGTYFVLGIAAFLFFSAVSRRKGGFSRRPRPYIYALAYCVFYALSDEIHQLFVFGRACRALDVLIDSGGAALALAGILLLARAKAKRRYPFSGL